MVKHFFTPRQSRPSRFHFGSCQSWEGSRIALLTLESPVIEAEFSLLQVSDAYSTALMEKINSFFADWPKTSIALEVSHASWFASSSFNEALQKHLQKNNASLAINNAFGSRYFFHPHVKQEHLYIRYIGDGFIDRDRHRLRQWRDRLGELMYSGMDIYFVVKDEEEVVLPTINYLKDLLGIIDAPEVTQMQLF